MNPKYPDLDFIRRIRSEYGFKGFKILFWILVKKHKIWFWIQKSGFGFSQRNMQLLKEGVGIKMDSVLPHLVLVDDDLLSTGIVVYHLKVGSWLEAKRDVRPLESSLYICISKFPTLTLTIIPNPSITLTGPFQSSRLVFTRQLLSSEQLQNTPAT